MRRTVAFLFHAPGLWLLYRERLDRALWRPNAIAVALTLLAMAGGYRADGARGLLIAWAVGHVAWGAYLARAYR